MLLPNTVAVTIVVPTCESFGHWSDVKADCEQRPADRGSPTRPWGRIVRSDFTSSVSGFDASDVSTVRSGWPPACVVLGVTVKFVMVTVALAAPGNITATTIPRATAPTARLNAIPTSMSSPLGTTNVPERIGFGAIPRDRGDHIHA